MVGIHIDVSVRIFMYTWTHTEFENMSKIVALACAAVVFDVTCFFFNF